jgi:CBS-domain-containing membrane protein
LNCFPHDTSSKRDVTDPFATLRSIIGGHLVGVLVGSAFALFPHTTSWAALVIYALAVGSALLLCLFHHLLRPCLKDL